MKLRGRGARIVIAMCAESWGKNAGRRTPCHRERGRRKLSLVSAERESDYGKYRGRCKEMADDAFAHDQSLTVVCGWYICPFWGKQAHWWCVRPDGTIVDPSVKQFPTAGAGAEYVPYAGQVECEYCNKSVAESDVYAVDHHVYCSYECYGHDVGF